MDATCKSEKERNASPILSAVERMRRECSSRDAVTVISPPAANSV